ncbi:MAG TPA: PAS domain-containing protein [Candidatus Avacidaminococcus intestinavium]|uniref:histidine kinase n=1 Tax=Candidatus Avacidaminococcus intestinavium TaxID=2840684 RepID=A0A9D1MR46_9FIRM|nr:PAS domain-containing protein [Candidatus Avacidaminococcus intestinavium]
MVRKRVILLVQGLFLCAFLVCGAYILSVFQNYSTQTFKEKSFMQLNYATKLLVARLPLEASMMEIQQQATRLGQELGLQLEVLSVVDSEDHEIARAFIDSDGYAIRTDPVNLERTLYVAQDLGQYNLVIRSGFSLVEVTETYNKIRIVIIAAFVLAMFVTTILARKLAEKIAQPLEEITQVAKSVAEGDLRVRLQRNVGEEFAVLSHSLNSIADLLAERNDELSAQKKKLELIMKNTDNSVVNIDQKGFIIDYNDQFAGLFGENILGKHHLQIINNVNMEEMLTHCLKLEEPDNRNLSIMTKLGKKVFQIFCAPLKPTYMDKANSVLFVFHDITALQAVYEKQAEFVSNASHELATPLTTIKGFAEVLVADGAENDFAVNQQYLEIILKESDRMQALLHDLLQVARLDSEEYRKNIKVEAFFPGPIMEKVCTELKQRAVEKNLQLEMFIEDEDLTILANPDWFKQILLNLLENALKYTPEHGLIKLGAQADQTGNMCFTVHNTGEGIAPKDAERIFDRFYRIDKARTRQIGGTGLGLSIVKFIVEMFGGKIHVESQLGKGTAFIFTIPRSL